MFTLALKDRIYGLYAVLYIDKICYDKYYTWKTSSMSHILLRSCQIHNGVLLSIYKNCYYWLFIHTTLTFFRRYLITLRHLPPVVKKIFIAKYFIIYVVFFSSAFDYFSLEAFICFFLSLLLVGYIYFSASIVFQKSIL